MKCVLVGSKKLCIRRRGTDPQQERELSRGTYCHMPGGQYTQSLVKGSIWREAACSPVATITVATHTFNGPFSGTTQVSRYQKSKTNLDFTEARDSEWQWNQLGHMQVCTLLQTDNHATIPPLSFFNRPDALPAAQPTASKHLMLLLFMVMTD